MERCNLDIVIYMNGMTVDYDTMTRKSLGGSETAGVSMAHALAKRGHHVSLFCNTDNAGKHDGVNYIPIDSFMQYASTCPHDVLICQRVPMVFQQHFASKINILWQHDYAQKSQRAEFTGALWNVDKVFCLSDWHINNYLETYKLLAEDNAFFKTSNGIKLIKPNNQPRKNQVVFTNRPERGMDNLLYNILPKLWEKDQEIEVVIAGYDNTVPQMQQYYSTLANTIKAYAEKGFKIRHVGALTKKDLYKLYQESKLFLYPTNFYETSCITAMETQMCGLPMITSNRGALPETLGKNAGIIIDGQANSPEYTEKFVESAWKLMNDEIAYKKCQKEGYEYVKKYDWDNVAKQWEKQFLDMFSEMTAKRQSLYHHLYEREDIMTYKYLAEKVDCDKERAEGLECLYGYIDSPKLYKQKYEQLGKEYAKIETDIELRAYHRVNVAMDGISNYLKDRKITSPKMLDFASGIGNESILFTKEYNAKVDAVNISAEENILAEKMKNKFAPKADINFLVGQDGSQLKENYYDVLFMGEILEHQPNPDIFIDELEKNVKKGGLISFTVPFGMWDDRRNAHLWNFERQDLYELFSKRKNISVQTVSGASNVKLSDNLGWWIVSYQKTPAKLGTINLDRKLALQSPRQLVSTCMIVKNEEAMLGRALASVADISDEIIIADNGSTDRTLDIAKQYGATIVQGQNPQEIGFDEARNFAISHAKNSWILWIDADEELQDSFRIIKYLRNNTMNGYSLKQVHFSTDPPVAPKVDLPIRLFRNHKGVRFYGFVHEHPEIDMGDGVGASMICSDVTIGHDGYLTELGRRKRFERNIPLMFKDREKYPDRLLGKFLMLRDYVHLARYDVEQNRRLTKKALEYCNEALKLFDESFARDNNLYQDEALSFYSEAMKILGIGLEYSSSLVWVDQTGKDHNIDIAGRFKSATEFLDYQKTKLKALEDLYTGEFL